MSRPVPRNDVEIEGRFVLLELGPHEQPKRSKKEFSVGKRRWQLSAVRVDEHTSVTLSTSSLFWDKCLASVTLKLVLFPENQPVVVHNRQEVDLPLNGPHTWTVTDGCKSTRCLVEIEFRNITEYGKTESFLRCTQMRTASVEQAQSGVARMLREGILTDITVNAAGGSMRAHRAVLAARSPVFLSMFSHNLREKELSTVDISDMSIGACKALVRYLYGDARSEWELLEHRSELVAAGDKYGISNLKKACEESLREDVGVENVLDRLQMAHTYSLPALKRTCVRLLVDFGKMYEIPEDFEAFMAAADQDLADEIRSTAILRGRKLVAKEKKPAAKKTRRPSVRKSPPSKASGSSIPVRRSKVSTSTPKLDASNTAAGKRGRRRKSTPSQDPDGGAPDKRPRRLNVRLAGDEWAK
ncbi:BTB/POZ domain-containing protein At1g55760-like [Triticum dicoccoides]|uniref:BTB/POZ domain-containing protein At1g55760-like n=1 Tax=Triticum dicoccoides TaxID=85692 RepID=UPI00188E3222|nr:BTB/POZ domain-containing protein At1g55760-like [Triticum dicoccoides]